ncbi:hypothetical protein AB3N04_01155 (plasmid) [Alkalihalophilus sp. As8PL]|uniref:TrbL/VirB6 plasmid conjugal transfer protein n=1 Tax=Alkalihalophilus sp. As8PL TaxID=3237103 RepID=A0AB39BMZ4_9BACI
MMDRLLGAVGNVIEAMWDAIVATFGGLRSIMNLVYGDDEDLIYNTFNSNVVSDVLQPGINVLTILVSFFMIIGIVYAGSRLSSTGINPSNRTVLIEFLKDWVLVAIMIANVYIFYDLIFTLNAGIIDIFRVDLEGEAGDKWAYAQLSPSPADVFEDEGIWLVTGPLAIVGWMMVQLFLLFIMIWMNFYYLFREITLILFMVLGPVFISLWMIQPYKSITLNWLREFTGTVLVQSVHAVTLWVAAAMVSGLSGISIIFLFLILIPLGEAIKNLFNLGGDTASNMSKFASMAGLSGIAATYGAVKSAREGGNALSAVRDAANGGKKQGAGSSSSSPTDAANTGASSRAERMLRSGEIMSKAGKMTLGVAGAVGGAALGPKGSFIGAGVGGLVGGVGGAIAGRAGHVLGSATKSAFSKGLNGAKEGISGYNMHKDDELANEMGDMKTDQWAKSHYQDFMDDQIKNKGKSPEEAQALWNNKEQSQREAFRNEARALIGKRGYKDQPDLAKADDLVKETGNQLAKNYEDTHKEQYLQDREAEGMSKEDATKSWDNHFAKKKQGIYDNAYKVADEMRSGRNDQYKSDLAEAKVRASNVGEQKAEQWAADNKDDFYADKKQDHLDKQWDSQVKKKYNDFHEHEKKNPDGRSDEQIAQSAKQRTEQWASENRTPFMDTEGSTYRPDDKVHQSWDDQVKAKKSEFTKDAYATEKGKLQKPTEYLDKEQYANAVADRMMDSEKQEFMENGIKNGGYHKALDTARAKANEIGDSKAQEWADENKGSFYQEKKQDHMNKQWDQKLQQKFDEFQKEESQYGDGRSSEEIQAAAQQRVGDWTTDNKKPFMDKLEKGYTPTADVDQAWNKQVQEKQSELGETKAKEWARDNKPAFYEGQKQDYLDQKWDDQVQQKYNDFHKQEMQSSTSRTPDQIKAAAQERVNQWSDNNKEGFMNKMDKNYAPSQEVDQAWDQQVQQQRSNFVKGAFKEEKAAILSSGMERGLEPTEVETQWNNQKDSRAKAIVSATQVAGENVQHLSVGKGFENRDAILNQTANELTKGFATEGNKAKFMDAVKQEQPDINNGVAEQMWNKEVGSKHQEFYQQAANNLNTNNVSGIRKVIGNPTEGLKGAISGAYQGTGLKSAVASTKDVANDFVNMTPGINKLVEGSDQYEPQNVTEKQDAVRKGVAYASGALLGASGYAIGSKLTTPNTTGQSNFLDKTDLNPYSKTSQAQTMDVGDMARYAKKETVELPNGQTRSSYANGAIQMVVENDRSYMQVKGNDGQIVRTSRYGAGDTSLQQGERIIQDYTIDNDMLAPAKTGGGNPSVYKLDSTGHKSMYSNPLSIQATDLISKKVAPSSAAAPNKMMEHKPLNPQVEQGSFTLQDLQQYNPQCKVTTVIEKGRSYAVMKDPVKNETYRVSDYGPGDASLSSGETVYKEYVVENGRFTQRPTGTTEVLENYTVNSNGDKEAITGNVAEQISPKDLIPRRPNTRVKRRMEFEEKRFKQGVV